MKYKLRKNSFDVDIAMFHDISKNVENMSIHTLFYMQGH